MHLQTNMAGMRSSPFTSMKLLTRIYRYLLYRMHTSGNSPQVSGNGLPHEFVEKALHHDPDLPVPDPVVQARKTLLANTMLIPVHVFGAGKTSGTYLDQVGRIVRRASVPARQGAVLNRLAACFRPDVILELGTCVGLGTLYLSLGHPAAKVTTVEGNRMLADIADSLLRSHGLEAVRVMQCTFEEALRQLSATDLSNALIFIDGDHTYEATLGYFNSLIDRAGERCVMIFHDIHWSGGMHRAWVQISSDTRIKTSYDLYDMGILCNFGEGPKKDFVLRY